MNQQDYIPTIGMECHVQLKTKTKLFAAIDNDARQAAPNSLISHICVGLPGALPVLNRTAIELSTKAALALGTEPQAFSWFERKHYFYPDLPKGYQITQYEAPIIVGGEVEIAVDGQTTKIAIERANLEEDAGKNMHPEGADYSLVDLNRAGTPLLEIVTAPDMHSPAEAKALARELWLLMKYADVTDGDLYHGHVRFDVNVSLSQDQTKLGIRSEVKNLNSFRSVEAAVAYEIKRQAELLEKGERVVQETRGWDEAKQRTTPQRTKEEAEDYRYMPEPDVPPVELGRQFISKIRAEMPEMPSKLRQDLSSSGFSKKQIENILDDYKIARTYISALEEAGDSEVAKVWSQGVTNNRKLREAMAKGLEESMLRSSLAAATATVSREINSNQFNLSLEEIILHKKTWEELGLKQVSDELEIEKIVAEVLVENQPAAEDVKKGELKAIGFLVGQVMQKSGGQANPALAQKIIKKQLNIS